MSNLHTSSNPVMAHAQEVRRAIEAFKETAPDLHRRLWEAEAKRSNIFLEYEPVEPILLEALRSEPDPKVRSQVAEILKRFGPRGNREVTGALLKATEDQDSQVRQVAKLVLLSSHTADVRFLLQLMKEKDLELCRKAISELREMSLDLAS